jgi:hypothetical protein
MRTVNVKMLRDGTGRVCIHWFIRGDGPISTAVNVVPSVLGMITIGGVKGWIACNREQNTVSPQVQNGETFLCCHTDDPRAATCPSCKAVPEYAKMMAELNETVNVAAEAAGV